MTQPIHQTKKRVADGKGKMSAKGSAASPSGGGSPLPQRSLTQLPILCGRGPKTPAVVAAMLQSRRRRCSSTPGSGWATRSTTARSTPRSTWTRSGSVAVSRTGFGSWATRSSRSTRRSAPSTEERQFTYANLRAEAYARMRDRMIRGEVGLPYSPELGATHGPRVPEQRHGKLQVIAKEDWRQVIHRSPDRLDAVMMAVAARGTRRSGALATWMGP